jgi:hypothetical protein
LVNVIRKPIFDVVDVGKTLIMPGKSTVLHVDLEDPGASELIIGRTRR